MGSRRLQGLDDSSGGGLFANSRIGFLCCPQDECYHPGGLFASVGQMGSGIGLSPNSPKSSDNGLKFPDWNLYTKYVLPEFSSRFAEILEGKVEYVEGVKEKNKKKGGVKLKIKVQNPSLRRLISGAIAGAVSRTAVAPLETIRTHLMVGTCGHSSTDVLQNILKNDGWQGLFAGNLVNVIRVAPSKAIEQRPSDGA